MQKDVIKKMVEDGFAIRKIAAKLKLKEQDIKELVSSNNWNITTQKFDNSQIDKICNLYEQGVSAKILGKKFSIDKRRVQKWAKDRNILRNKSQAHRITFFNEHIFDIIDTSEKAYWLGFFYADAYNCDITNTISVSLQISDLTHLQKLADFIGLPYDKIKYSKTKEGYEYYTLKIYSKYLSTILTAKGCPRAKSFIITFPEWLEEKFHIDFIRGMFDGDGSLAHRENDEWKWSLATTKECGEMIQRIILKHLDVIVNLSYISKTNHNTYELEANGNQKVLKLARWLYDKADVITRLDRKVEKMKELQNQQDNKYTRQKQRNSFLLPEEDKIDIVNQVKAGETMAKVAKDKKCSFSTVQKIIKNSKSIYEKVVCINDQPITAKYVKTLDYDERMALVEPLFQHFRQQGWLYPDNNTKLGKSWKKLLDWQPDLSSNELFNNSSLATDICKFFCHKFYDATEYKSITMKEVFYDDEKLKYLIKNRLGFDWWDKEDNDETFNISFRMLVQGMRSSRLVPSISIFKPNIAKYLCMKYSQEGGTVYDYSAGWGGRMLGVVSCKRNYIGVDPWTSDELENMLNFLKEQGIKSQVKLINSGSEQVVLEENSIDFSFSSPPYFDQEVYSKEITQAYAQGEEYFYNIYWKNTLENVKYMLKPGKWFGLNVKNYPKMLDMAVDIFGEVKEHVVLRTIKSHLNKKSGTEKNEYIYMFMNDK